MSHEYRLLPRLFRWLRRFPKRRGYGVHSPFAFQFITDVVYSADAYYAYASLRQPLVASLSRLDEYDPVSGLTAKDLRLIFRLANFQEPAAILALGASPAVEAHLQAARPSAALRRIESSSPLAADASSLLVYSDDILRLPSLDTLFGAPPADQPRSCLLILRGIHRSPQARACWQQLQEHHHVTLTFDLWRFGIALKRPKINKQHYVVNYF